jgi:hypothetical protein
MKGSWKDVMLVASYCEYTRWIKSRENFGSRAECLFSPKFDIERR